MILLKKIYICGKIIYAFDSFESIDLFWGNFTYMKKRNWWKIALIVVAVLLVATVIGIVIFVNHIMSTISGDVSTVERSEDLSLDFSIPDHVIFDDSDMSDIIDESGFDESIFVSVDESEDESEDVSEEESEESKAVSSPKEESKVSKPPVNVSKAENYESKKYPIYKVKQKDPNVLNVLLVGRDEGTYFGNADSIMVVSYNKKNGTAELLSIQRDSYVPTETIGWTKITNTNAYGGVGYLINTVNAVYGLDIQHYMLVDFQMTIKIIDAIGGIDIDLSEEEVEYLRSHGITKLQVGINTLKGYQALEYARARKLDSDFNRSERQRKIIISAYNKVMKLGITDGISAITTAMQYVKTNIPLGECISLATNVISSGGVDIHSGRIPFEGTWKYGKVPYGNTGKYISVVVYDFEETRRLLNELLYSYN